MKKSLFIVILFYTLLLGLLGISANATEVNYGNLVTDETSIEEDFELLNIDINDYYKPKIYDYEKWYVIAMSEAYIDEENYDIQTYFYLYNPTEYGTGSNYMSTPASIYLTYLIGSNEQEVSVQKLEYNQEHLLYKVKGFTYSFTERTEISILKVQHYNMYGQGITSESDFKAVANHSKLNGFQVELSFNSTLIIEEYKVVEIEVTQDNNLINNWNSFWAQGETKMLVYFYNFNFPDHIEYDEVIYAKFSYYYNNYHEKVYLDSWDWSPDPYYAEFNEKTLISREKVLSEYNNDSKTLRVNEYSLEMTFPTFYLGNRIEAKQFGNLDASGELDSFNYDCSVLLDSTYKTSKRGNDWPKPMHHVNFNDINYTTLDDVEFLELWYKNDGVVYKCQVVSKPVDEEEFDHGTAKPPTPQPKPKSLWEKFVEWFLDNFPISLGICAIVPIVAIVLLCMFPELLSKVIEGIIAIIRGLIWLVTLPFRMIIGIFKRD